MPTSDGRRIFCELRACFNMTPTDSGWRNIKKAPRFVAATVQEIRKETRLLTERITRERNKNMYFKKLKKHSPITD